MLGALSKVFRLCGCVCVCARMYERERINERMNMNGNTAEMNK